MNTTNKFDGYSKKYTVGRPGYAKEMIDCLYNEYGMSATSVIADIGSGTGKFARHLLERKSEVYCVEPNDDMRMEAENELYMFSNFHSIKGDAENTTLEDNAVDFITTAQAFHWFNVQRFKQECARILKDNGKAVLIWNMRDESDPLNQELYRIFIEYCPDFKGFGGGIVKDDPRIKLFFNSQYDYISFDNPLYYDREKFIARSLSGSYSLKEGDRGFDDYFKEIESIFNKYVRDGIISIGNRSVAYIGKI
ncbi:MAG: class I SAM-dependent methyltransferase [Lachnospiraceae bacterium]|nr:class I SAM-dependent methyltransferase [Lachnospiraceae bacterium]